MYSSSSITFMVRAEDLRARMVDQAPVAASTTPRAKVSMLRPSLARPPLVGSVALIALGLLVLPTGCGESCGNLPFLPGKCGTTGVTGSGTTDESSSSASETSEAGTSTGTSSTASESAPTDGTTGPQTTSGATDGDDGLADACMTSCKLLLDCMLETGLDACAALCIEDNGGTAECVTANVEFLSCLPVLTCQQISTADLGPCLPATNASEVVCGWDQCSSDFVFDPQNTACSLERACPKEPSLMIQCDEQTCACLLDGMPTGETCASETACESSTMLVNRASACCGF